MAWHPIRTVDSGPPNPMLLVVKILPSSSLLSLTALVALSLPSSGNDGFTKYTLCAACHGQSGEGTTLGPPLAGSEWVNGPAENLIRIQLRGMQGPITVKGVEYHFPAGMPPLSHQSDEDIAAVLTFVRSSFGNDASAVTPQEVAAIRKEPEKAPVTVEDLLPPSVDQPTKPVSTGKYDDLEANGGLPVWAWISAAGLAAAAGLFAFLRRS